MTRDTQPSYEEVREKLRALGYLDGPVERFVLEGAIGATSVLRSALSTSFRVAVLGGPLLGAGIAAGAVAIGGPALAEGRNIALLFLYLSVPCVLGLFLLELASGGVLSLWASRRGRGRQAGAASTGGELPIPPGVVARGGVALTVLLAGYLALWWRNRAAAAIEPAGAGATALVLGLFLLITTMLWRFTSLASLAAIIRRTGRLPAARSRGGWPGAWRRALYPVAAGLLLVALALAGARRREPERPVVVPLVAPGPVAITGIDGLDAPLAREVAARCASGAHEGPGCAISGLLSEASTVALDDPSFATPPVLWTSIATGLSPEEHGVRGMETETIAGVGSPLPTGAGFLPLDAALTFLLPTQTGAVSAEGRRGRAIWEIIGEHRPAAVAGWWATMPALPGLPAVSGAAAAGAQDAGGAGEATNELIVSDQTLHALARAHPSGLETWPTSLYQRYAPLLAETQSAERRALDAWVDARRGTGVWIPSAHEREWLVDSLLVDGFYARVARDLATIPDLAGVFSYYPGFDILRQRIESETGLDQVALRGRVVSVACLYLDLRAGDILERSFPFDPARAGSALRLIFFAPGRSASREGWGVLEGPGVTRSDRVEVGDIAPTLLAWAGWPAPADARGRVRLDLFDPPTQARLRSAGTVPSYGRRPAPESGALEAGYEDDMLERLRSLGYVR